MIDGCFLLTAHINAPTLSTHVLLINVSSLNVNHHNSHNVIHQLIGPDIDCLWAEDGGTVVLHVILDSWIICFDCLWLYTSN